MRILLIYPGHSWSTIDVATGYESALRTLGHEVRAYNYHKALEFYYDALNLWRQKHPAPDPDPNTYFVMASERVVFDVLDFVPDVALIVSGFALHPRACDLIYRLAVPIVLLLTESPYLDGDHAVMIERGHVALTFTNEATSAERLPGRVLYLPHSFDPARHYPRPVDIDYWTDLFFHGTLWPERKAILAAAAEAANGGRVRLTGIDAEVESPRDLDACLDDFVHNDQLANWYSGTRIALNHHRTWVGTLGGQPCHIDSRPYSLGPRAFEIAACGAFQLCDDSRGELADVFAGSVATYDPADLDDLKNSIRYWLDHEEERTAMAAEARERVRLCTFENRARSILIPTLEEVI